MSRTRTTAAVAAVALALSMLALPAGAAVVEAPSAFGGTPAGAPLTGSDWSTLRVFDLAPTAATAYTVDADVAFVSSCSEQSGAQLRVLVDGEPTGSTLDGSGSSGRLDGTIAFVSAIPAPTTYAVTVQARFLDECATGGLFLGSDSGDVDPGMLGTLGLSEHGSAVVSDVVAVNDPDPSSPTNGRLGVSWTAGSDLTGVGGWTAEVSTDGTTWSAAPGGTCATGVATGATSCQISGLSVGTIYQVRVAAVDDLAEPTAWSRSTASAPAAPANPPGPPSSLQGTTGNGEISVTWSAPAQGGGSAITDYVVQYRIASPVGDWTTYADGTSSSAAATLSGLTDDVAYDVRVKAVNVLGSSTWLTSASPFTIGGVATAPPTVVSVTPSYAPLAGGTTITIIGTGLNGSQGAPPAVRIAGTDATSVTVSPGGTTVTAVAPAGSAGWKTLEVVTDLGTATVANGFFYAQYFALNNGSLRFGTGSESSVNSAGTLQQPWYYSAAARTYYKLTYSSYPLDYAVGSGTGGANWSGNTVTANPSLSGQVIDYTGFVGDVSGTGVVGYGTVTSTGTMTINGQTLTVRNSYTLTQTGQYVRVSTRLTNTSGSAATNVNIWVGTRDDWVGGTDSPTKTKGNLVDGAFAAISQASTPAQALQITSGSEGVLFYTTNGSANTSINSCCSFSNAYNTNPTTSSITLTNDGSYAINLPAGTIDAGSSAELTWFYAAGSLADLSNVASEVAAAAAPNGQPGNQSVSLTWTAPASDQPITNYAVRWSSDGGSTWTVLPTRSPSTLTSETVGGLTNGTAYIFQVAAITGTEPSTSQAGWSASSTPVTPGVPTTPSSLVATPGNASASIAFTESVASDPDWPITNYQYQIGSGSWTAFSPADTTSPVALSGLTNGTTYSIRLRAQNSYGVSSASSPVSVTPRTVPGAPGTPSASAGNASVALSWSAPSNGGSAITDYVIETSSDGGSTWTTYADGTSATTSATVSGLTNGSSYVFRVSAVNAAGTGPVSGTSSAATPRTTPGQPTGVVAAASDQQAALTWTAPAVDGGAAVTDYVVQWSSNAGGSWTTFADGTSAAASATVTGLTNGSSYIFRVSAVNAAGTGSPSTPSEAVTPRAVPSAPTSVSVIPGDGQVAVSWAAPVSTGGTAVVDYVVSWSDDAGSTWWTWSHDASSATSATITGLTNGTTYRFSVAATNAVGTGPTAVSEPAVPVGLPTAPGVPALVAGDRQIAAEWAAPTDDGGTAVTDYVVEISADAGETWNVVDDGAGASAAAALTGLRNGTAYLVRVSAANAVGTGPASEVAGPAVPKSVPDAPTGLVAEPGDAEVVLTWSAPASDGGTPVVGYVVEQSLDGGGSWAEALGAAVNGTTAVVASLGNGQAYLFRVAAENLVGTGAYAEIDGVIVPLGLAGAPQGVTAEPGDGTLTITWSAPLVDGGAPVERYTVEVSDDDGSTWTAIDDADPTDTAAVLVGAVNGTEHLVRVAAVTAAGTGAWGMPEYVVVPRTVPGAPDAVLGIPGDGEVEVRWSAPASDGGSPITGYAVEMSDDGGLTWNPVGGLDAALVGAGWATDAVDLAIQGTSTTVSGLVNGTAYVFHVHAVNVAGTSDPSGDSEPVTPQRSGPPDPVVSYPSDVDLLVGTPTTILPTVGNRAQAVRFVVVGGRLPVGLALDARTGVVSGTPLAQGGPWRVRIGVQRADGTVTSSDRMVLRATGGYVVYFNPGSRTVTRDGRRALKVAAAAIEACPSCTLQVRGYAAYINGSVEDARRIAKLRAEAVRDVLRDFGVRRSITLVIGVGHVPGRVGSLPEQRKTVVSQRG